MDRKGILTLLILTFCTFPATASNIGRERMIVKEVVHGDTLIVQWRGKTHTLRLLGIDSPPSTWGPSLLRKARLLRVDPHLLLKMGQEARDEVKRLLPPDKIVYVEFDWIKRDPQGRLMGYAYVREGMLNAILIARGYARARLSFPFPMRPKKEEIISLFPFLERKAQREKLGLWRYGRF